MKPIAVTSAIIALLFGGLAVQAQTTETQTRVVVTIENLAPNMGTFQTPFWVAFHNGGFDIYDRDQPASLFFPNNPHALERLAEDGTTSEIAAEFLAQGFGTVEATLPGPEDPIAPGNIVTQSFVLDPFNPQSRYFSYASMVIPSNDFFIANGDPLAHPIFDDTGQFVATSFFVTGAQVLDAGTEVNDEVSENTAFFGQTVPNTGVDENGVVHLPEQGFKPPGSGGILDDPRFAAADFLQPGYPVAKISFRAAPAIIDARVYQTFLTGSQEVPPVDTPAFGVGVYQLLDGGTRLSFSHGLLNLENVVAAHLHRGAVGENGPIVAFLMANAAPGGGPFSGALTGEVTTNSLTGPLLGQPLDVLIAEIEAGNIYVNVHTDDGVDPPNTGPGDFPGGEIRGQLSVVTD